MAAGAKPPASGGSQGSGDVVSSIAEDFVERVWGFLSVKEGLRSRLRSQTSREREEYTHRAANLSLTYHFLTPLTNLVVEKPEVLADNTVAPAATATPAGETVSTANELPNDTEDGKPGSQTPSLGNMIGEVRLIIVYEK